MILGISLLLSNVDVQAVDIESTIMAAVSGSCKHFCSCWADADSRIMTDGFHICLETVDLEGICLKCLEVESTVCCTEAGRLINWEWREIMLRGGTKLCERTIYVRRMLRERRILR